MRPQSGRTSVWVVFAAAVAGGQAVLAGQEDLAQLDKPVEAEAMQARVESLSARLRITPDDPVLLTRRGEALFRLRDYEHAIADFDRAIQIDPKQDDAWFGRGMAHGRNGEVEKGIADLGVYIDRNPGSSLAYTKRGVRRLWQGDLDAAGADLREAVRLDPRNAEAHDDLGVVYAQRGEYAAAQQHFSTTVRIDRGYQKAWHNLAMVYYITDQPQQALDAVERSLQLHPEDRNALLLKGTILESLGHPTAAQKAREDAELLPGGNWSEHMSIQ